MKGRIVQTERYWNSIMCRFETQCVIEFPSDKINIKLGEVEVKQ